MDQFDLNLTSFKLSYASQAPSGPARLRWDKIYDVVDCFYDENYLDVLWYKNFGDAATLYSEVKKL